VGCILAPLRGYESLSLENATAKFEFSHVFLGAAFGAQLDCLRCPTSASSLYLR